MSTLGKVAKELSKVIKMSTVDIKGIGKEIETMVDKVAGMDGGKGDDKKSGEMEAKMKKIQDQMKQITDLSSEIQKSLVEINKNMDK